MKEIDEKDVDGLAATLRGMHQSIVIGRDDFCRWELLNEAERKSWHIVVRVFSASMMQFCKKLDTEQSPEQSSEQGAAHRQPKSAWICSIESTPTRAMSPRESFMFIMMGVPTCLSSV